MDLGVTHCAAYPDNQPQKIMSALLLHRNIPYVLAASHFTLTNAGEIAKGQ